MTTQQLIEAALAGQLPREQLLAGLDHVTDPSAGIMGWTPANLSDAEWALECLADSEAELAAIDQQLAEWKSRAEARAAQLREKAGRRATFFRERLLAYGESNKEQLLVGKKKSRELLGGKFSWRQKGGRLVVTDKKELEAWLPEQDASLFRVKVEPQMDALNELAKSAGIVPPGCEWESVRDELTVTAVPLTLTTTKKESLP